MEIRMELLHELTNAKEVDFKHYFDYPILHGLIMEFGAGEGGTINKIADLLPDRKIFGFDSFQGLPEDWRSSIKRGAFKVDDPSKLVFRDNVTIMPGMFDDKIPKFFKFHKREKISLIHIDCDLYSSTKTVLDNCKDRFHNGAILIFDEIYLYDGFKDHEFKAFDEFLKETNVRWECLGKHHGEGAGFRIWKEWEYEHK